MAVKGLFALTPDQLEAARPDAHRWVSASAGTGKTQVLSARVFRILLEGAEPSAILALTFTKAAAAEMQTRIFERLAHWVRAPSKEIKADLAAIGAEQGEATVKTARTLFARALESNGGLRVQTLHGFASSLLAAFPLEAGIVPGFATLEDRSGAQLKADVLEGAVEDASDDGDHAFLDDLAALAIAKSDGGAVQIVNALMQDRERLLAIRDEASLLAEVRHRLGLPREGSAEDILRQAIADDVGFDAAVQMFAAALNDWNTKTGRERLDKVSAYMLASDEEKIDALEHLVSAVLTQKGTPYKASKALAGADEALAARVLPLVETMRTLELAETAALYLRVGRRVAARYEEAKAHRGALDFGDMIVRAAKLLSEIDSAWVLYKLDQRIDHVLVDEGQDTNAAQWTIVEALTAEFFAGEGAQSLDGENRPRFRSLFSVGDYKQAIFGFQGSDPDEFDGARERFGAKAIAADQDFAEVDLGTSFRSVPAVLDVVDATLSQMGGTALGLTRDPVRHHPFRDGSGAVTLWPRLTDETVEDAEAFSERPERELASRIASEIGSWIADRRFIPAKQRTVNAGDILVLVRKRDDFVPELVAALHREGVPVAGADRLRLTTPIVVQDCLALIRFALQPNDDLTLGELLVSPFLGWSQKQLYDLAQPRGAGVPLWDALRDRGDGAETRWLEDVLRMADFRTPYDLLETVMSGPLQGRAKLLKRLGEEARDPLEELMSQALAYELAETPSLQGFLDWIASADDIDVKRDPEAAADAVRIMTVHGAKGLQAPIVVMADAARARAGTHSVDHLMLGDPELPLYGFSKAALPDRLREPYEAEERRDAEESARLLYVAMTRAEDYLYVGGIPPTRDKTTTWYDMIEAGMLSLDPEDVDAANWGGISRRYARGVDVIPEQQDEESPHMTVALPDWVSQTAPPEARPPRPLAPSKPEDDSNLPPPGPGPALKKAALRGRLMHLLFERLPSVAPTEREDRARAWLRLRAEGLDIDDMVIEVMRVMTDPVTAPLFGSDALAEAPISATVDDRVVAGTIDVLLVDEEHVRAVDYKTDRNVPETALEIPQRHRNQMSAYRAALEKIFPDRRIETSLLYTAGPALFDVTD
ncbi:MAG: double-strand break repair helicase AddA [Pacificimonas sp.]